MNCDMHCLLSTLQSKPMPCCRCQNLFQHAPPDSTLFFVICYSIPYAYTTWPSPHHTHLTGSWGSAAAVDPAGVSAAAAGTAAREAEVCNPACPDRPRPVSACNCCSPAACWAPAASCCCIRLVCRLACCCSCRRGGRCRACCCAAATAAACMPKGSPW